MSEDREATEMAAMIYRQHGNDAEDFVHTMIRSSDAQSPNGGDRWRLVLRALEHLLRSKPFDGQKQDRNGG